MLFGVVLLSMVFCQIMFLDKNPAGLSVYGVTIYHTARQKFRNSPTVGQPVSTAASGREAEFTNHGTAFLNTGCCSLFQVKFPENCHNLLIPAKPLKSFPASLPELRRQVPPYVGEEHTVEPLITEAEIPDLKGTRLLN